MTDVMVGVIESGTGRAADINRPAAGKTGTAQAYRAAWFVGYTPDYATAVWMGHADRLATLRNVNGVGNVTGGSHPALAWQRIMAAAHEGLDVTEFPEPVEITAIDDDVAEVLRYRLREFTEAGDRRAPARLAANCGGVACQQVSATVPDEVVVVDVDVDVDDAPSDSAPSDDGTVRGVSVITGP
jgi:membrane peptidoglycan carboxypeptidase